MKNNIIALPAGRIRRGTILHQRKQAKNPDLYVDMVESNAGHISRREARRAAYYQALADERQEVQDLNSLLATTTFLSLTGGTLAVALALIL